MKILFLLIVHSVLVLYVHGQEKALAKVHYLFSHINDTTSKDQPLRDEVVLLLGKKASYYRSFTEDRIKESIQNQKLAVNFNDHLEITFSNTLIKNFYLYYYGEDTIFDLECISSGLDLYYREEQFDIPNWTILENTKLIGGYLCQLATTKYKGRKYDAWFTTELPFQAGPWKLQGLPGLVLSAYDQMKEVAFDYGGFETLDADTEYEVAIPYYALKGTQAEIAKQRMIFEQDQGNYYKMLNSSGRLSLVNSFYGIDYSKNTIDIRTDDAYKPSFKTNNPIELLK